MPRVWLDNELGLVRPDEFPPTLMLPANVRAELLGESGADVVPVALLS